MTSIDIDGIYYTIYDDHVYVGHPNKKGVVEGYSLTSLSFKSIVDGKPVIGVLKAAFFEVEGINSITFPDSIKIIEDNAFDVMGFSMDELILPKYVEYIGRRAFANSKFKTVKIPETCAYIGTSPFGSNSALTDIIIDPMNKHYNN